MLAGTMAILAMRTGTPELAIHPDEEKQFLMRAQNVLRHYSVTTTQKTLDWTAFMGCALGMVGTRAFAIRMRLNEEAKGSSGERGQVLHFKPRNPPIHRPPASRTAADMMSSRGAPPKPEAEPLDGAPLDFVPSVHGGGDFDEGQGF